MDGVRKTYLFFFVTIAFFVYMPFLFYYAYKLRGSSPKHLMGSAILHALNKCFHGTSESGDITVNPFRVVIEKFLLSITQLSPGSSACPCCGFTGSLKSILHKDTGRTRDNGECPACGARERHRAACLNLATLLPTTAMFRLLHFGPQKWMEKKISSMVNIDQISMDFFQETVSGRYSYSPSTVFGDVAAIPLPSQFVDGILILHVLEHVPHLDKGLQELNRVSKNGAWMLVEVPCSPSIGRNRFCGFNSTSEERTLCAGQNDHYWRFSCQQFTEELQMNNFTCKAAGCSQHVPKFQFAPERDNLSTLAAGAILSDSDMCRKVHHRGMLLICQKTF